MPKLLWQIGVFVTSDSKAEKHQHCIVKYLLIYCKSYRYRDAQQQNLISHVFLTSFSLNFEFWLNDRFSRLITTSFSTHEQHNEETSFKGKENWNPLGLV